MVVTDDVEKGRMPAKMNLALYIGGMGARDKNFYNDFCKRLGYEDAAVTIQDYFLDGKRGEAIAAVPDELVDELFLIGPRERIIDRLGAWKQAGQNNQVHTMMINGTSPEALELVAKELL